MKTDEIALIVAMRSEARPLINALSLKRRTNLYPDSVPFESYTGSCAEKRISITVGGQDSVYKTDCVGTQPAALMTWLAIEQFNPDLIINAGTAGGMADHGCGIGEIYLSEGPFCFHDRRIPIPRFREYGIGSYPSIDTSEMAASLGLKKGRISTGDSLDMTETDLVKIRENGAFIKEMEAAAIAWVCQMTKTPMFAVKVITDLIDRDTDTEEQFVANLQLAVQNLQHGMLQVLNYL